MINLNIELKPMLPAGTYKGKRVLITGGGTGLGKSMAMGLAALGADIIICGRREEVLKATCEEITKKHGVKAIGVACDVRECESVENLISEAYKQLGGIDALINNAAGNFISPTERLSHRAFDSIVNIVLKGSYNCTLALGKKWIADKTPGSVLNIVTTYASTGSAYVVPSACAKAGVLAMTRSLGVEWAKYGIRLNAIAPGPFPTEGAWSRLFPEAVSKIFDPKRKIPLKRFGAHEELANLASYILSDYASYMTGEVVTIDGGEWLKGAGEFNALEEVPSEMWDLLEAQVKKAKGKK